LEQDTLFKKYDDTKGFWFPVNQAVIVNQVKVFQCPSSKNEGRVYNDTWTGPAAGFPITWSASTSDYMATSGVLGAYWDYIFQGKPPARWDRQCVFHDSPIDHGTTFAQITEGTTNSIMVCEMAGMP